MQTLRAQLEARTRDHDFARRSLERSKHEKATLQGEAEASRDALRRLEARVGRNGGPAADDKLAVNGRYQQMAARLEQEEDTARTQKRE
eukprot:1629886-Prymnesium_polylepis.1